MTRKLKDLITLSVLTALLIGAASLTLSAAETAMVCTGTDGAPVTYADYRDWRLLQGGAVVVTDGDGNHHIHPAHANCHVTALSAAR